MEELTNFALRFYRILAKKAAKDEKRGFVFLFFHHKSPSFFFCEFEIS